MEAVIVDGILYKFTGRLNLLYELCYWDKKEKSNCGDSEVEFTWKKWLPVQGESEMGSMWNLFASLGGESDSLVRYWYGVWKED